MSDSKHRGARVYAAIVQKPLYISSSRGLGMKTATATLPFSNHVLRIVTHLLITVQSLTSQADILDTCTGILTNQSEA